MDKGIWIYYEVIDQLTSNMVFYNYFSDLTDGSSFERAKFWVEELLKNEEVIIILPIHE